MCAIKQFMEGEATRIQEQRTSAAMGLRGRDIEAELPARVPGKEDPEAISSESGGEEWEGCDAKPAGFWSTIDTTTG